MEDGDDFQRLELGAPPPPFAPEGLRPVYELNDLLIGAVIDESRRPGAAKSVSSLGALLGPLDRASRSRIARVPISLLDASFLLHDSWSALSAHDVRADFSGHELALPRSRCLELAPLLFSLAASVAQASRESACLMFGMSRSTADAFSGFSVPMIHWLAQVRAHWIRPRWHDRTDVWRRLVSTAANPDARLPTVAVRAINQMAADLERATSVWSETRRMRP